MAATRVSCVIISIFSGILALLFLAVTILGAVAAKFMGGQMTFGFVLIAAGVVGLLFAITGFLGACYRNDKKPRFPLFLIIFFIGILIVAILFLLFGIACFFIKPTISFAVTMSTDSILKLFPSLTEEDLKNVTSALDKINSSLTAVGVVALAIAGVIGITIITTSCHMGIRMFSRFFIAAAATIMLVVGVAIVAVIAMYFKLSGTTIYGVNISSGIMYTIIAFAAVMILLSVIGYLSAALANKCRCFLFVFLVGVVIIFIGFLGITIASLALTGVVNKALDTYCEGTGSDYCQKGLKALKENMCGRIAEPEEKKKCEDKFTEVSSFMKYFQNMFGGWLMIVFFFSLIVTVFLAVVAVSTCCSCRSPPEEVEDDSSVGMPDYRAHKDVAY